MVSFFTVLSQTHLDVRVPNWAEKTSREVEGKELRVLEMISFSQIILDVFSETIWGDQFLSTDPFVTFSFGRNIWTWEVGTFCRLFLGFVKFVQLAWKHQIETTPFFVGCFWRLFFGNLWFTRLVEISPNQLSWENLRRAVWKLFVASSKRVKCWEREMLQNLRLTNKCWLKGPT